MRAIPGGRGLNVMSRSRRKTPIIGMTTAISDKPFKVDEHRRERRSARAVLASGLDADDRRMHAQKYGDPWKAPKDGKQIVAVESKWMRK
jgi:hypothetical protein